MTYEQRRLELDWQEMRERWDTLPLLSRGESKEIRTVDDNIVMVRLIPSLYSFTQNRSAMIEGTDTARLKSFEVLAGVLKDAGIQVAAIAFGSDFYVTHRLKLNDADYVPPIEVIVKARHVGTPKHVLYEIAEHPTRDGDAFVPDTAHLPYVRFDYTNPLKSNGGERLRDECIPSQLADRYIDVVRAEQTAMSAFCALYARMSRCGIRLDDVCFKIDHTGQIIFGEISPDCMRAVWVGEADDFFGTLGEDRSKDTFRAGSAPEDVKSSYDRFVETLNIEIRSPVSPFDCPKVA